MSVEAPHSERFSLMNGGPAYRIMCRLGLGPSVALRALALAIVTWLPLFISSAFRGVAIGNQVDLPFLLDIAAYARFIVAVPLLILAERTVDRMLGLTVSQFTASDLVKADERPKFESAVGEMVRHRDSVLAEVLLLGLAFVGSLSVGRSSPGGITTWHGAVWWYSLISIPIYQFLLYRWLWRFGIWSAFLRRVSRLDLQTVAIHPDLQGGLAFLAVGQAAFYPIVLSSFIVFAAIIANLVIYAGAPLLSLRTDAAVLVVVVVLLFVGPLFFFTPKLIRLKIASVLEYGVLAARYTHAFDRKWVRGEASEEDELLGSADIQSLADLSTSYDLVRAMKVVPFGLPLVLAYLLSALVPLLSLAFLAMPADEIGRMLFRILKSILG